jgi:hypothetical protein
LAVVARVVVVPARRFLAVITQAVEAVVVLILHFFQAAQAAPVLSLSDTQIYTQI